MTTSEPTTALAEYLRTIVRNGGNINSMDRTELILDAADRLESQEAQINQLCEALAYANEWHKESVENATNELRELSGITGELEQYKKWHDESIATATNNIVELEHQIAALTARAEQAEKERDAANERVTDYELSSRGF